MSPDASNIPSDNLLSASTTASAPARASQSAAPSASASVKNPSVDSPLTSTTSTHRSSGLWLGTVALLLAVGALIMGAMLWQKIGFTQQEMARRSQDSAAQVAGARALASQSEALVHELQARLAVVEIKLSEVTLQRSQLEELMLSLSRSRDDNLVQDIDSALRLAMQQTQLTGSAQPLVSALQAADQRISHAAQPRLNPVQRAIARDVERIQSASLTDIPSLVRRLDEVAQGVDNWPVYNEWRSAGNEAGAPVAAADKATTVNLASKVDSIMPNVPTSPSNVAHGWARLTQSWAEFWKKAWRSATQSGRELVRVSRIDHPEAALLAPEQVFFLRENIKLRLLNARLGLLSRQIESVQRDLQSTEQAMGRYFDRNSASVEGALDALALLRTELSKSVLPRPDESLAALATAAGGR